MHGLRKRVKQIVERINTVDWYQVRFIPSGAADPLPPLPRVVEITETDVDLAIEEWNELMPEFAGILQAQIEAQRDFD